MNLEFIEKIVGLITEYPVTEISVEREGHRVSIHRPLTALAHAQAAAGAASPASASGEPVTSEASFAAAEAAEEAEVVQEEARTLTATMVGIFHHAEPPIPYAAIVNPGQVVGSIESMKLMNEVVAEAGGRVVEVLVEDGAPVEYGQSLFRLAA